MSETDKWICDFERNKEKRCMPDTRPDCKHLFDGDKIKIKRCPKCKEEKNVYLFYNNSRMKDGKSTYCKACSDAMIIASRNNRKKAVLISKERILTPSDVSIFVPRIKKLDGRVRKFFLHLCPHCEKQIRMEFLESDESEDLYFGGCEKCGCEVETTVSCAKKK